MPISRWIAVPAALILLGLCGPAAAEDAPLDLHAPAAKAKPGKDVKDAKADAKAPIGAAEAVRRANAWLASAKTMTADFVQIGSDGHRAEGKLYVERPGRLRFQYAPPDRLEIVADGRSLAVRDQKLDTQDLYLIGQTPLKFLLKDSIDLAKDTRVLSVASNEDAVTIAIEDNATFGGSAHIELLFDPTTFALKQWTSDDEQGNQTVVTLFGLDLTSKPDESLFKIDEQRMLGNSKR